ncbi:MAG: hypothetical protein JWO09_641 [Bacteroidetes bacterium]|nr:hypothetical protein [Bacteroidota bacterium]
MQKIAFILLLFISATCCAQLRSGFYSNFTIHNKTDDTLKLIEKKLVQSLEAAKKSNKYPPFRVYSYYPGWRMELTLSEISLNGNAEATNDYSLSMQWQDQNIDSGFVTGYSKIYRWEAQTPEGKKETMAYPLRTIALGDYRKFVTEKEYIALFRTMRTDLIQKLKLQPAGQSYISTAVISLRDPLSQYNTVLLTAIAKNFLYRDMRFYGTPLLSDPLNRAEIDALIVSTDTVKSDSPGVYAILTDHIEPRAFEVVTTWEISIAGTIPGKHTSDITGGLVITRKISAVGIVAGKKKAYCRYEDFKRLCESSGLDFNSYNQLFNARIIDEMEINPTIDN